MAAAENELRSHLGSGEKLLWTGRPAQGIVLTWQDGYLIPFAMLWLGSAVHAFWPCLPVDGVVCTLKREPLALFVAAGLLFTGSGIYLLIGRFLADLWHRSRLIYGVTDRRAIILSGMCRRSVQSIYFSSLITLKLEERRNSGTIYFGEDHPSYRHDAYDGSEFGTCAPGGQTRLGEEQFFRIADAKKVFAILKKAIQRQRGMRGLAAR